MTTFARAREDRELTREARARRETRRLLGERQVPTGGLDLSLTWRPAVGATEAVVEAAWLDLAPLPRDDPGEGVAASLSPNGNSFDIVLDGPLRPVRSVRLTGLTAAGSNRSLRNAADIGALAADLPGAGAWRLTVAIDAGGGFGLVQFAVPFIGQSNQRPALLAGAHFDGRVLHLPDVPVRGLRVSLMRGDLPEDLVAQPAALASADVRVAPAPLDLAVSDADGPVWAVPGALADRVRVDLRNSVERGLNRNPAAAATGIALKVTTAGRLFAGEIGARGHLLRNYADKVLAAFEGDRQSLPLGPLETRAPDEVRADVTIVHEGLRLHPLSAAVPAATGGLAGVAVGAQPCVHALPPGALTGETLVRVGVVGFGTNDGGGSGDVTAARLGLRLLEAAGPKVGQPIAEAHAAADVPPTPGGSGAAIVWFVLAKPLAVDRPLAVELTATARRFLWVEQNGVPAVRFAVACAPGGQLQVAGMAFAIAGERTDLPGQALPAAAFAGGPVLAETDQFCRLTLSNLRLRYAP
jgi:hypothetical protein